MFHLFITALVIFFTFCEDLINRQIHNNNLKTIVLFFTFTIQFIVVYSYIFTQKDRSINVYVRSIKQKFGYQTKHDIMYSPEILIGIASFYLLNKVLIYYNNNWLSSVIVSFILLIPLFISFIFDRIRQYKYISNGEKNMYFIIYCVINSIVLLIFVQSTFRHLVIILLPIIKLKSTTIITLGIYLDSLICIIFNLYSPSHYICSILLLVILFMFKKQYLSHNSHKLLSNILYIFGFALTFIIFTLESKIKYTIFKKQLIQCFALLSSQIFIIFLGCQVTKILIIWKKDKSYLQHKFFNCFKQYFENQLQNDDLIYRHLKKASNILIKIFIIVLSFTFPTNYICCLVTIWFVWNHYISLSYVLVLRMVLILINSFKIKIYLNIFLQYLSLYLCSFGKTILSLEQQAQINFNTHNISFESPYLYYKLLQQKSLMKSNHDVFDISLMIVLFTLSFLIQKSKSTFKPQLKCIYISFFPLSLLFIERIQYLQAQYYLVAGVKFLELYYSN